MSRIVRASKFRHIFGTPQKNDQCFNDVKVTRSAWDSNFCAVNPKFIAMAIEGGGGGPFLVLKIDAVGRVGTTHPICDGHSAPVLDLAWYPFNDNIIATCSEDCTIKIWMIPDEGILETTREAQLTLTGHQRRVLIVSWHPTAENVLLSSGADNMIVLWDVGSGCPLTEISCHPDNPLSVSWNYDGSLLATTCKDKTLRVIDPRSGNIVSQKQNAHEGTKSCKVIFLKDGKLMTFGFSRMSDRQYALWDGNNLTQPIIMEDIDRASGVLFPYYDPDTEIIYVAGKGDANMRYFEYTEEHPYIHYINTFQSSQSQRGMGFMPKRGCDVNKNEVARFFKLHPNKVEPISFTVPRKSELFQPDIFPPTASAEPAVSCEEWWNGVNSPPRMLDLSAFHSQGSSAGGLSGGFGSGVKSGAKSSKFGAAANKYGSGGLSTRKGQSKNEDTPISSPGNASPVNNMMTDSMEQKFEREGTPVEQQREQHAFDLRHKIQSGHVSSSPFMAQKTNAAGMALSSSNSNNNTRDSSVKPSTQLSNSSSQYNPREPSISNQNSPTNNNVSNKFNFGSSQNNNASTNAINGMESREGSNLSNPAATDVKRANSVGAPPDLSALLPEGFNLQELLDDVKKMKATIKKQGRRIATLEGKLGIEK